MKYILSWNTNNKDHIPKIHKEECIEIAKNRKDKLSKTHKYSDSLNSCNDIKEFLNNKNFERYNCCKTCNPNCCDD